MVDYGKIEEHMPVICNEGNEFATVDHLDGDNFIKLTQDNSGQHHWIPVEWVTAIDDHIHIDRSASQAMKDWLTSRPV